MKENQASTTAEYAAAFRALETVRRQAQSRLFEDPFAIHFLSAKMQRLVRFAALPIVGKLVRAYIDYRWPGAMTSGIARTRLIDEILLTALEDGIRQVVILGAGFDSRAYRLPGLEDCRVVEVDISATQNRKRELLTQVIGVIPDHVEFVPADLTKEDLNDVLKSAGLDQSQGTIVIWEGVTHYIGETAVDATLHSLSSTLMPGSRLVFTYLHGGLLDGTTAFEGSKFSREQVAGEGEPWIWGIDPALMPQFLSERGFQLLEDVGADEYREQYWGTAGRRMRGFGFYRVALAEVI